MKIIEALKYIIGITVACLGWFIATTVTEIRADLKILLEAKAHQTEQIRALERATFGKVSEQEDFSYNPNHCTDNPFLFDKTKTLQYKNGKFIYS